MVGSLSKLVLWLSSSVCSTAMIVPTDTVFVSGSRGLDPKAPCNGQIPQPASLHQAPQKEPKSLHPELSTSRPKPKAPKPKSTKAPSLSQGRSSNSAGAKEFTGGACASAHADGGQCSAF